MTSYIGQPPVQCVIVVTRGCDRSFTLSRQDVNGAALDWDADVYMDIDVTAASPVRVEGSVSGPDAVFLLPGSVCDRVGEFTQWRAVMSDSVSGLVTALLVGVFERDDGRAPS